MKLYWLSAWHGAKLWETGVWGAGALGSPVLTHNNVMSSTEVEIHISKAMPKSKNQVPHPVSGTFCLQAPCSERRETGCSRAYSSHLHGEETLWEMHQVPWGLREEVSLSWGGGGAGDGGAGKVRKAV